MLYPLSYEGREGQGSAPADHRRTGNDLLDRAAGQGNRFGELTSGSVRSVSPFRPNERTG